MTVRRMTRRAHERTIGNFIGKQPESWQTGAGMLQVSERISRLDFAERYASSKLTAWLKQKNYSLEELIDSHSIVDRAEFCMLLAGKWVDNDPSFVTV